MIVNHNVKKNQFVGTQRAHFELSGTGSQTVMIPLSGPKQIRKITIVTGDNSAIDPATVLNVRQMAGGSIIVGSIPIQLGPNIVIVKDESSLDKEFVKMNETFDGLAFEIDNALVADVWSLRIEVIYSARTNVNNNVYVDEKIEGLL